MKIVRKVCFLLFGKWNENAAIPGRSVLIFSLCFSSRRYFLLSLLLQKLCVCSLSLIAHSKELLVNWKYNVSKYTFFITIYLSSVTIFFIALHIIFTYLMLFMLMRCKECMYMWIYEWNVCHVFIAIFGDSQQSKSPCKN